MPGTHRLSQINSEIRARLAQLLRDMKDPRVGGLVSVTRAEISRDYSVCKVYISTPDNHEDVFAALRAASGFLRTELGQSLRLRHTPRLVWVDDRSIENGARIISLIRSVTGDDRAQ
jgi:ribosome-binding factor A